MMLPFRKVHPREFDKGRISVPVPFGDDPDTQPAPALSAMDQPEQNCGGQDRLRNKTVVLLLSAPTIGTSFENDIPSLVGNYNYTGIFGERGYGL